MFSKFEGKQKKKCPLSLFLTLLLYCGWAKFSVFGKTERRFFPSHVWSVCDGEEEEPNIYLCSQVIREEINRFLRFFWLTDRVGFSAPQQTSHLVRTCAFSTNYIEIGLMRAHSLNEFSSPVHQGGRRRTLTFGMPMIRVRERPLRFLSLIETREVKL